MTVSSQVRRPSDGRCRQSCRSRCAWRACVRRRAGRRARSRCVAAIDDQRKGHVRELLARPFLQGAEIARAIERGGILRRQQHRSRARVASRPQRRLGLLPSRTRITGTSMAATIHAVTHSGPSRIGMRLDPVAGDVEAAGHPNAVVLLDVVEQTLQADGRGGWPIRRMCRPIDIILGCVAPSR